MLLRRTLETVALMMIGDGALAVLDPERHMKLWEHGPHLWEMMMQPFVKRPCLTRWLGAVELLLGICLAQQQKSDEPGKATWGKFGGKFGGKVGGKVA